MAFPPIDSTESQSSNLNKSLRQLTIIQTALHNPDLNDNDIDQIVALQQRVSLKIEAQKDALEKIINQINIERPYITRD